MGVGKWFVVLFLFVAAFAGMTVFSPIYTFLFIPIVCFGAILVGKPRAFIYLYLSIQSIYPLLQTMSGFEPLRYLNEIMAAVLFVIFFGNILMRRMHFSGMGKYAQLCFSFFGYCLLVWLINRGTSKGMLQFFFVYMSFIPLFFLVREYFTDRDFGVLLKWTICFFLLNFVLNLGWWFRINPIPNWQADRGNMFDHALGTLNGQTYVSYFCGMLIFLLLAVLMKSQLLSRNQKKFYFTILIAVFVQFFMTFTNHTYVFFAIALIPFVYISNMWKNKSVLVGLVLMSTLFVVIASQSEMIGGLLTKKLLVQRYDEMQYSPKLLLYKQLLVENRSENTQEWLIGVGPGNGMGPIGMDNSTPFALRMLLPFYDAADPSRMQMTSITGNTYSAVFSIWGDLGLIGSVLFYLIYTSPLIFCLRKVRSGGDRDALVGYFLIASFILWGIIGLVFDAMHTVLPLWLWIWMGWLLRNEKQNLPSQLKSHIIESK